MTAEPGLGLATIGQLFLGENSSPQAIAKVGDTLYITLGGGYTGPESIAAGQKIAKVDVKDPTNPTLLGTIDLSGPRSALARREQDRRPPGLAARAQRQALRRARQHRGGLRR